jgi:hypothetical protein
MTSDSHMLRLRRANPVPAAPTTNGADLFAQITATPSDPRITAERPRPRPRRAVAVAVAVALAVVLASAAYAISRLLDGEIVHFDVTKREYLAAEKQLTLPPGVAWPAYQPPPDVAHSVTSRGAGGGTAVLIAQNAWECYWVDAIRGHDTAAGERAQAELDSLLAHNILVTPNGAAEGYMPTPLPKQPVAVFAHDGGLDWIRKAYREAAAGDVRNLAQRCRANAPADRTVTR